MRQGATAPAGAPAPPRRPPRSPKELPGLFGAVAGNRRGRSGDKRGAGLIRSTLVKVRPGRETTQAAGVVKPSRPVLRESAQGPPLQGAASSPLTEPGQLGAG